MLYHTSEPVRFGRFKVVFPFRKEFSSNDIELTLVSSAAPASC